MTAHDWQDDYSTFEWKEISALRAAPDVLTVDADKERDYAELRRHERYKKARQRNRLRSVFFYWAASLATLVIVGSWLLVGYYAFKAGAQMDTAVVIAWISGTVVQLLGIIYIVAQYLFPRPPSGKR